MARRLGDPMTLADSMTSAGRLLGLLDREEALTLDERALAACSRFGHLKGQDDALKGPGYSKFRMEGGDRLLRTIAHPQPAVG
jgi:hypothetical protein